jgi:hypothetical protein
MTKMINKSLASLTLFAILSVSETSTAQILEVLNSDFTILVPNGGTPDKFAGSDFPQTKVGESTSFVFQLTTGGSGNFATVISVNLSGAHPGDFAVDPPDNLVVGGEDGSRPLGVSFNPTAPGTRTATVTINYEDPAPHAYTFQVRGSAYANLPIANSDIAILAFDSTFKLKKKTQTIIFKGKVTVANKLPVALEEGVMQVYRSDEHIFDDTATLVTTIPLKPLKGKAGDKLPQKKYKFKLDMGSDFNERIFIRIFPIAPIAVDDFYIDNHAVGGYSVI